MRRTASLLSTLLFVLPLLGAGSPRDSENAAVERNPLEGMWDRVDLERNGHRLMFPKDTYVFRGRTWEERSGGSRQIGSCTFQSGQKTGQLDILVSGDSDGGRPKKYLYQIEGDTLKLAFHPLSGERPGSFSQEGIYVATYRRMRK